VVLAVVRESITISITFAYPAGRADLFQDSSSTRIDLNGAIVLGELKLQYDRSSGFICFLPPIHVVLYVQTIDCIDEQPACKSLRRLEH
jgi:hypothetical protein